MNIPSLSSVAAIVSVSLLLAAQCKADIVAEWKFDSKTELGGGQVVTLDTAAENASTQSLLMSEASYSSASTGLGDKWQAFLGDGYLDSGSRVGKDSAGTCGLVTKNTTLPEDKVYPGGDASYRAYMGFIGFGSGMASTADGAEHLKGGTVYMVVSPSSAWSGARAGIMGTGHIGGAIFLSVANGELSLRVGPSGSAGQAVKSAITAEWAPDKWYFIAGSWAEGQPPVLLVREMDPAAGPKASPAALKGESDGSIAEGLQNPEHDPLVIGANWINTGADTSRYTQDGANARVAYARFDNIYSTPEDMEKVFESLGAQ